MEEKNSGNSYKRKGGGSNENGIKIPNYVIDDKTRELADGERYTVCKKCGKTFEQEFYPDRNCYSSYKTCHACRWELAQAKKKKIDEKSKEEIETATAVIKFSPHPWQAKAREEFKKHRFNVWALGNRSGKDFCANMIGIEYFVECLNENRHIEKPHLAPSVLWWIIAPTEDMAKQNWRDLKKQFPKDWIVAVSDSSYTMQTVCGGVIEVRSAYNPESLVGVGLDLCTITEAARIDYNKSGALRLVWANLEARLSSPERGLEKDRKGKKYGVGKAIINSTPLGKNFFYEMFKWGQPTSDTYDSNWYSLQEPWTCNPANKELADTIVKTKYGNMRYEDSLRRRIGDRKFRENYLADFLAGDGTVFKDFDENCVVNIYQGEYERLTKAERENFIKEWREPKPYGVYRIGYDPATGSSADDPAIVIRDMSDNKIVWIESMYGKNYDEQYERIAYLSRRYNYAECCWLRTGHTAIEGNLAKRGVVEVPLNEQNKKGEYIQSLEAAVQNKDIKVLGTQDDTTQILIAQMNDYTEVKGKYSNKSTEHDDFVSALYAVYYDYSVQTESQIPIFYANIKTF